MVKKNKKKQKIILSVAKTANEMSTQTMVPFQGINVSHFQIPSGKTFNPLEIVREQMQNPTRLDMENFLHAMFWMFQCVGMVTVPTPKGLDSVEAYRMKDRKFMGVLVWFLYTYLDAPVAETQTPQTPVSGDEFFSMTG